MNKTVELDVVLSQLENEYRWSQARTVASYFAMICMVGLVVALAMVMGVELHAIGMAGLIVAVSAALIRWGDLL